jgi:hypothetical protein
VAFATAPYADATVFYSVTSAMTPARSSKRLVRLVALRPHHFQDEVTETCSIDLVSVPGKRRARHLSFFMK